MTEQTAEPTTEVAPATGQPAPADLGDAGKQAIDRMKAERDEARRQAKAGADAVKRLAAFEDRDKTEAQRLTERAEAAEKRALDLESRALRLEVGAEKGLKPAQVKRLVGTTRQELEADADELLADFTPATEQESTVQSLDLGTHGSPAPASVTSLNGDPILRDLKAKLGIR